MYDKKAVSFSHSVWSSVRDIIKAEKYLKKYVIDDQISLCN